MCLFSVSRGQIFLFFIFRNIKKSRDAYIKRLNGIYESNLDKVSFCVFYKKIKCSALLMHYETELE